MMYGARLRYWAWLFVAVVMLLISRTGNAAITDGKFGINQIFDVQYWWNGTTLNASNFIAPYDKNFQTVTVTTGQYFKFFPSTTNPGSYGLGLYNSNDTLARVVHDYGDITALGNGAIFYIGSGFFGNVISTAQGYTYGSSASFANMDTDVTSSDLTGYTWASTTPLAAGETAAPAGPPPPDWKTIRTSGTTVYITKITPLVANSPAGEQPGRAFDGSADSKYLHFDKKNSGITLTLSQGRVIQKMTLTTGNDSPGRDPTYYRLYGSNDGVTWTLIKEDNLSLSANRKTTTPEISLGNTVAYAHYHITFPQNKYGDCVGGDCNIVQIAEITFYYDSTDGKTSTDTSGGTVSGPIPPLCCGASAASFSANTTFTSKVNNFVSRPTGDAQVSIVQIGSYNSTTVQQSGTTNNASDIYVNGNNNITNTTQTSTTSYAVNYIELDVIGSNNTVNLTQNSQGGTKGITASVNDNNNILTISQENDGNHYAEINLAGSNKSVNLTQTGSAGHMAKINLSGGTTSLTATQQGSTQQYYSISHTCAQASCAAISVTQGQ